MILLNFLVVILVGMMQIFYALVNLFHDENDIVEEGICSLRKVVYL